MTRKVNLEIPVTILVPVQVTLDVLVRADEGANMDQAVRRYLRGKPYSLADVEDIELEKVVKIGNETVASCPDFDELLKVAIDDAIGSHDFKLGKTTDWSVTDSR